MKLLRKRVLGIPVLAILVALVVFGVALAVGILATIPSSVNVTGQAIGVYTDDTCATPVEDITWGDVAKGTSAERTVYVRNEGTVAVVVSVEAPALPTEITLTAPPTASLAVDASAPMVLTLTVDSTATVGPIDFTTNFLEPTP